MPQFAKKAQQKKTPQQKKKESNTTMSAPLELLAGVVAREAAISPVSSLSSRPSDVTALSQGRPRAKRFKSEKHISHRSCTDSASHTRNDNVNISRKGKTDSTHIDDATSSAAASDSKRALR